MSTQKNEILKNRALELRFIADTVKIQLSNARSHVKFLEERWLELNREANSAEANSATED